jgi:hypothetical protein
MPPKSQPKAHEMTTEQVAKALFPKKAREALRAEVEPTKSPKNPPKSSAWWTLH